MKTFKLSVKIRKVLKIIICILFGYLIAVLSFRRDLLIEHPSENYSIKYRIFPFSRSEKLPPNFFSSYFKYTGIHKRKQSFVDTRTLFPFSDTEMITMGQQYIYIMYGLTSLDNNEYKWTEEQKNSVVSNTYFIADTLSPITAKFYVYELTNRFMDESKTGEEVDTSIPVWILTNLFSHAEIQSEM